MINDLDTLTLEPGAHDPDERAMCVMEAVAFMAGEPWSDHPECASPVIGAFLRSWNDSLDNETRQQLKQYIPRLVGSKGTPDQEDARAWLAMDWLIRTCTPTWLRFAATSAPQYAAGLAAHAERLASLPEIRRHVDVSSVRPLVEAARAAARAAGPAAWDAARAGAWDATRDAALTAARDAAWDAAVAAAWDAAWDRAMLAAWDAAVAAAVAAAKDAPRDAARARLQPAVTELQTSAHDLVDRMLTIKETGL